MLTKTPGNTEYTREGQVQHIRVISTGGAGTRAGSVKIHKLHKENLQNKTAQ